MFDPDTGIAFLFAVGQDFPLKVAVQLPAEKRQNVPGRKVHEGMVNQSGIEILQLGTILKQHIRRILGLFGDPVIVPLVQPTTFRNVRIDISHPAVELFDPVQLSKSIGDVLSSVRIFQFRKTVIVLHEAQATLGHLPSQPVVAVDVHLYRVREPRFQPDMHQAEALVNEVIVQHSLWALGELQTRSLVAMSQLHSATGLLHTQHGHKPFGSLDHAGRSFE